MSTAAAVGHHHHHHHPQIHHLSDGHAAHPGDPVLAAATAAAMDAAAPGAADGVDASATEAAVAATGTFVGGPDDDDDDEDAMPIVPGTKTRKNFEERLKELRKFKQKHGHCQVPHKFPQNPQLGTWVDTQRRLYRAHKRAPGRPTTLSQENIEKLLEVGFNFEPRRGDLAIWWSWRGRLRCCAPHEISPRPKTLSLEVCPPIIRFIMSQAPFLRED